MSAVGSGRLRVGILMGGRSREREISFAGGRTVYDNLDRRLFEPVPIFIDSLGRLILLEWSYLYKGTIRDFYPPSDVLPESKHDFQLYIESLSDRSEAELEAIAKRIGTPLTLEGLKDHIDLAFLTLHGPYGEDGTIQGMLEWAGIPYTGCGILSSAIGLNKITQDRLMRAAGFPRPKQCVVSRQAWDHGDPATLFAALKTELGFPFVVKSPQQGSSIGVTVLSNPDDVQHFYEAGERSLFRVTLLRQEWRAWSQTERVRAVRRIADIREGIGLPVRAAGQTFFDPEKLYTFLEEHLVDEELVTLESAENEQELLFESMLEGKEFSCIVLEDQKGKPFALPPTEIRKRSALFDYRAKYLPGISRKVTPIELPDAQVETIRTEAQRLFAALGCDVYARIDGFIDEAGNVTLNDPNTTSGMLPSSFFFHQAAEIGLSPSQLLSYIIHASLRARLRSGKNVWATEAQLTQLETSLSELRQSEETRTPVAVILGGYSSERHISVESGRNIYEKLASSTKYVPTPVLLTGSSEAMKLYRLPMPLLLKDNADDIAEGASQPKKATPLLEAIRKQGAVIAKTYGSAVDFEPKPLSFEELADQHEAVFIALHGRPGEDGALQRELEKFGLPYNGSGPDSSQITINKYETNERLHEAGILVAHHRLIDRAEWVTDSARMLDELGSEFGFPLIGKPADDGCSSAVMKIDDRGTLECFLEAMLRDAPDLGEQQRAGLGLSLTEEFPRKDQVLIESLIGPEGADRFLEITGGLLTSRNPDGSCSYQVFEPSEALASGGVLSLEEKFLAGEGQNLTPSRFSPDAKEQARISAEVRKTLQQTAELLNVEGYARIDAFVRIFKDGRVQTIIIEVNSLPGMTPATCIFHQSALAGYTPYGFIDAILSYAREKRPNLAGK